MTATKVQVVFDCADPAAQAAFWAEALHYIVPAPPPPHATWEDFLRAEGVPEGSWNDANAVEDPDGAGPRLYFQKVPESKVAKNRMHLDLNVGGGSSVPLEERRRRVDAEEARRDRRARRHREARRVLGPDERSGGERVLRPVT